MRGSLKVLEQILGVLRRIEQNLRVRARSFLGRLAQDGDEAFKVGKQIFGLLPRGRSIDVAQRRVHIIPGTSEVRHRNDGPETRYLPVEHQKTQEVDFVLRQDTTSVLYL